MFTTCPSPVPGAPSIQAGRSIPNPCTRNEMYCETPIATTPTIAVYSNNRSQPMNQPTTSPRTAYP